MTVLVPILVATLSIWDYPSRQPAHERLRDDFIRAIGARDANAMGKAAAQGVKLLPDDPTWRYNLACSLARKGRVDEALDALDEAIRLGYRDAVAIAGDADLAPLAKNPRFKELVEYAEELEDSPLSLVNPLYAIPAEGSFGGTLVLGGQNVTWDFDAGCFLARVSLSGASAPNAGDLYFNRDGGHSVLAVTNWPGLTSVKLDRDARARRIGLDFPDMLFPLPVFGNCSRALVDGPYWRSLPRAMMTTDARRLKLMHRFYLSNQVWVFPVVNDYPSPGTNGDVFASVTPYWLATQGRSWSDQYYLRAALRVSRSLKSEVKASVLARGLLAPTVQALIRKSLKGVRSEADYLTPAAHPTAFPPNGIDIVRLEHTAAALTSDEIPPVAFITSVTTPPLQPKPEVPELTYFTPCAWAFVLRSDRPSRTFFIKATGGSEYAFAAVHDEKGMAKVEKLEPDLARVVIDRTGLSPTNRIDIAVFAKGQATGWGAPSFVSFAVIDPAAPYSDPFLTPKSDSEQLNELDVE